MNGFIRNHIRSLPASGVGVGGSSAPSVEEYG